MEGFDNHATVEPPKEAEEILALAQPLMDYLKKNHHPHTYLVVDFMSATVVEAQMHVVKPETNDEG